VAPLLAEADVPADAPVEVVLVVLLVGLELVDPTPDVGTVRPGEMLVPLPPTLPPHPAARQAQANSTTRMGARAPLRIKLTPARCRERAADPSAGRSTGSH
jgi:hypothetical protein